MERLLFTYEEVKEEPENSKGKSSELVSSSSGSLVDTDLKFHNMKDRKLVFDDEESLALKAIRDGQIDLMDKRINI